MGKWHNGPNGPGICKATKGKCPFGEASQHYDSKEKALEIYNSEMENKFGMLPSVESKNDLYSQIEFDSISDVIDEGKSAPVSFSLTDGITVQGEVKDYKFDKDGKHIFKVGKMTIHTDNIEEFKFVERKNNKPISLSYENPDEDEIQMEFDNISDSIDDGEKVKVEFKLYDNRTVTGEIKDYSFGRDSKHIFKIGNKSINSKNIKEFKVID